jgi:uncharacterized membrane-anchored protein
VFAILRDNDQRELVLSNNAYQNLVDQQTRLLHERRLQEKETMEEYLVYEEKAIIARKMHCDKEVEDRVGWPYDKLSRPTQVWMPCPDHY